MYYLGRLVIPLCVIALTTTGCANVGFGPGELEFVEFHLGSDTAGNPRIRTVGVHNQQVPDYLLATNKLEANFVVDGRITALSDLTSSEYNALTEANTGCRQVTIKSRPHELVAAGTDILFGGAIGAGSIGGASQAFPGASLPAYTGYGAGALGGSGLFTWLLQNGGKKIAFTSCTEVVLRGLERRLAILPAYP